MRASRRTIRIASLVPSACATLLSLQLAGCGPSNQLTDEERQDKAMKDPFGYSPDLKNADMTVSGHTDFDKQELKRDVDHVINP
jgi:hypothetical protein